MKPVKRGPGGRPTKEQSANIDMAILDSARSFFSTSGIAHATIDEIAGKIGVSKHTIYRRYKNKMALLDAVVDRDVVYFRDELKEAGLGARDALESLKKIAFRYVEIGRSRDYATFYHSVFAEAARSSLMRKKLSGWSVAALVPIRERIDEGQSQGLIAKSNPDEIYAVFVDLFEGVNNLLRIGDDDFVSTIDWKIVALKRWELFERLVVIADSNRST